jgi:hypothetical protein
MMPRIPISTREMAVLKIERLVRTTNKVFRGIRIMRFVVPVWCAMGMILEKVKCTLMAITKILVVGLRGVWAASFVTTTTM